MSGDDAIPAILADLTPRFTTTCYCRLATSARENIEVTFRLTRGARSVELCLDLFAQLLTPADALAAELARGAEAALAASRRRRPATGRRSVSGGPLLRTALGAAVAARRQRADA
jgi:hypothetical protein